MYALRNVLMWLNVYALCSGMEVADIDQVELSRKENNGAVLLV